eukprot:m.485183 g.485183  ORF g.485183 m.485183 type:complete len:141 (-) comp23692_c0_seq1:136-558(-)
MEHHQSETSIASTTSESTEAQAAAQPATAAAAISAREADTGRLVLPKSVLVVLKAGGRAPQLKEGRRKVKVNGSEPFQKVYDHLRRILQTTSSLFLYVTSSHIAPSPDQSVANIAVLFGRRNAKGMYVVDVDYAIEPAWG